MIRLFLSTAHTKERPCEDGRSEKAAIYKPGEELSPGNKSASTLILDFQPPEL